MYISHRRKFERCSKVKTGRKQRKTIEHIAYSPGRNETFFDDDDDDDFFSTITRKKQRIYSTNDDSKAIIEKTLINISFCENVLPFPQFQKTGSAIVIGNSYRRSITMHIAFSIRRRWNSRSFNCKSILKARRGQNQLYMHASKHTSHHVITTTNYDRQRSYH